nr:carbohydrate binding domain-containing protein [Paenibacillus sp. SYP-B3998]
MFRACLVLCLLSTFWTSTTSYADGGSQAVFYVDPVNGNDSNSGTLNAPVKTIGKARDLVRTVNANMAEDIVVYLRGGTYTQTNTLVFTEQDSGSNGHYVVYKSYPGETAVISGGQNITGWTLYDSEKNIYKASAGFDVETRQLYVNGKRAIRARSEGGLPDSISNPDGISTSLVDIAGWDNVSDMEMVFNEKWTNSRGSVDTITAADGGAFIKMKQPGWYNLRNKNSTSVATPWYFENAYNLLDQEGEWYLNRTTDTFYYKPRANENMTTAQVTIPQVEQLVKIKGSSLDTPIHNIQFEGISFAYTTWLLPNSSRGLPDVQSNVLRETNLTTFEITETLSLAAVQVDTGKSITFERCIFSKLGGAAINLSKGSQNNLIQGNSFTDISGSGIQIGELNNSDVETYNPFDTRKILSGHRIENNYFYNLALEYRSAVAIFASFPENLIISHNEIANLPYSGITIGWGWGDYDTANRGVRIENNYIHNVMLVLNDGGAIYTLGTSYDMEIRGNYLKDQEHDQSVLYFDMGSTWIKAEDNVVENSPTNLYISPASDIQVKRTYTDNYLKVNLGIRSHVSDTVFVTDGNWPDEALAIKANAGLEPAYQNIITEPPVLTPVSDHRPHPVPLPDPAPVEFSGKRGILTGIEKVGKVRNNYSSWVGTKITIGSAPLTVTALGRVNFPDSVEQHPLKIVDADTKEDVAGTQVTLIISKAQANGDFKYAQLPAPVILEANKSYYLVSKESNGGDLWYDSDLKVSYSSAVTVFRGVWGSSYKDGDINGNSFVGLDLLYQDSGSSFPPPIMLPSDIDEPVNQGPAQLPVDLEHTAGIISTALPAGMRNDWNGWVGMKLTIGTQPLYVSAIGRMIASSNTGKHKLRIIDADTEAIIAETQMDTSRGTPGNFNYGQLEETVRLLAGKSYYVLSLEEDGGDSWYKGPTLQTAGSAVTINNGIYKSNDKVSRRQSYINNFQVQQGFVGLDLRYTLDGYAFENLVKNGKFEYDTLYWLPYNGSISRVTDATYNNTQGSAKVTMGGSFGMASQTIAFEKNKQYEISVWVKLDAGSSVAQLILDHATGTPRYEYLATNTPIDTTWTQLKVRYKYTGSNADGTAVIQIRIGNGTTKYTYYFDNFVIKEIADQVFNGDFETNTSGWTPYNAAITRVTDATYGGSAGSAKIVMSNTFGMASQNLTLEKNVRYDVSAKVKLAAGEGAAQIILDHISGTPRYDYLATTTVDTSWHELKTSFVYTGPNANANAAMWIRIGDGKTKMTFYLDDIRVTRSMIDHLDVSLDKSVLKVGEQTPFTVKGMMADGSIANLDNVGLRFLSSDSTVAEATYQPTVITNTYFQTYSSVTQITYNPNGSSVSEDVYSGNNVGVGSGGMPFLTVTQSTYGLDNLGIVNGQLIAKKEGAISLRAVVTYNGKMVSSIPIVVYIDSTPPTATLSYSGTLLTNQDVIATITPSEVVTVTNNNGSKSYRFASNGSFTFEFMDAAGNRGTATAVVTNIDKTSPTLRLTVDKQRLWPANKKMTPINIAASAEDIGSGIASILLTSITSSDPDQANNVVDIGSFIQSALLVQIHKSELARNQLQQSGITLTSVSGQMKSINQILAELEQVVAPLSQAARKQILEKIFEYNMVMEQMWITWLNRHKPENEPDIQDAAIGTFDTSFKLRAERTNLLHERTYRITYEATDLAGNKTTVATQVVVAPN